MSLVCLMMAAACDRTGGEKPAPVVPEITIPAGGKTAGSELLLQAKGVAEDAVLYIQSGDVKTCLTDVVVTDSGVSARLPYNLGEYTLYIEQNDTVYELGKITIAVTDVVLPESGSAGDELAVRGNGFASDAVIVIGDKVSDSSAVPTEITFTVPEMEPGTYAVSVRQAGTEQVLSDSFVVVKPASMLMTSYQIGMDMGEGFEAFAFYSLSYENGIPVSFDYLTLMGEMGTAAVTVSGDTCTFTPEDADPWTFNLKDGKVNNVVLNGTEYAWTYDDQNHLISFSVDDVEPYDLFWDNNNVNMGLYAYSVPVGFTNKTKSDIALLNTLPAIAIEAGDYILVAAVLAGWCGEVSAELPSHTYVDDGEGNYVEAPFEYTADEEGYVKLVTDPSSFLMFGFEYSEQ